MGEFLGREILGRDLCKRHNRYVRFRSMKLSIYSQGRDNNFNLIRIVAALAVLVTHSFALAIGSGDAEPFRESLGMTMGSIAVDVFL